MLHTADGDESLRLTNCAGRPLWSRNAQGTATALTYEAAAAGGRPLSVTETAAGGSGRVRETFMYLALNDPDGQARNRAGGLREHCDNAGLSRTQSFTLTGQPLAAEQRLLIVDVTAPDWAALTEGDTDAPLVVSGTYDATGASLTTTNAADVTTVTAYGISGAVRETRLQYTESRTVKEVITLKDILRRADGIVLSQTAGNGVTDTYEYDVRTQRLTRHRTQRPAGHPLGALLISDLYYSYDPAGNILTLEDKGTDPVWHGNGVTSGLRTYTCDTLYRLTAATGRERTAAGHYRTRPTALTDGTAGGVWAPYTESYTYDDGDNLTTITHTGGSGERTVTLTVAAGSNRAVTQDSGTTPEAGFLTGGLQKALSDGRELSWHADGQLRQVSPVTRAEDKTDDTERYHYADGGTRVRKLRTTLNSGGTQTMTTTYTGGAETRQRRLEDKLQLDIVISDADGVRLVNDRLTGEGRLRYTFTDHLGSCGGEADEQGNITAREEYLPFGASAGSDEETTEVTDRTRRYSGKERDATGLLYYGWRYHQPELGRWLSADPGGLVDGVNLFRFTRNNPISIIDTDGRGCGSSKVSASQQAYDNWEAQQAGPSLPQFVSNPDVEAKFNAEGAVVYSGVEQLKSNAANVHAVYSTSLKYSIYLLGTASAKIATLDPKNEGLDVNKMKSRFDNLKKKLERRQEGGDLCNTIFGFKGYKRGGTDGVAFTVPDHYDQNIHFNLDVNKEAITVENIAATIIHEGSHLLFDAKDYYYVVDNAVLADDKETYASAASSLDGTLNKLLVKGTGTKAVLDAFDSMMDNLIEDDDDTQDYRSDDLADFENSKNIKHDKNYKKEHIMELFENNADSYPLLAFKYGVERTHQKRMQRLKY